MGYCCCQRQLWLIADFRRLASSVQHEQEMAEEHQSWYEFDVNLEVHMVSTHTVMVYVCTASNTLAALVQERE